MTKIEEIKELLNETKIISKDVFEQLDFIIPKVIMTNDFKDKLNDTSNHTNIINFVELVEKMLGKIHVYMLLSDDYHRNGKLSQQDMIQYEKTEEEINNILEMLLAEEHDYIFDPPIDIRTCKECGCTDIHACPGGCHWVTDDLCSNCVYRIYVTYGKKDLCIAEEVVSTEEVDAIMHGYSSAKNYIPIDIDEEIEMELQKRGIQEIVEEGKSIFGKNVLVFQVFKGEEIVGTYYYKKQ